MPVLSQTVIYLLVAFIQMMEPSSPMTVDYLQNDAPAMVIQIEPVENSDNDVYLVTASASPFVEAGETVIVRIEQTDLYAHNYLAFIPGRSPLLLDLGPIRRGMLGVDLTPADGQPVDLRFDLDAMPSSDDGDTASASTASAVATRAVASGDSASRDSVPAGPLYLLGRSPNLILAAPAEVVVLIAR